MTILYLGQQVRSAGTIRLRPWLHLCLDPARGSSSPSCLWNQPCKKWEFRLSSLLQLYGSVKLLCGGPSLFHWSQHTDDLHFDMMFGHLVMEHMSTRDKTMGIRLVDFRQK